MRTWGVGLAAATVLLAGCSAEQDPSEPDDSAAVEEPDIDDTDGAEEERDEPATEPEDAGPGDEWSDDVESTDDAAPDESDEPDPEQDTDDVDEPVEPDDGADAHAVGIEYFENFAHDTPEGMERMLELSAPDSPAEAYASFQLGLVRAEHQQGFEPHPSAFTALGDHVESCVETEDGSTQCTESGDFETVDGQLYTFTVNEQSLDGRLAEPGETVEADGVTLTLAGAYRTITSERLIVSFEIDNGTDGSVNLNLHSADYVDPDGQQLQVEEAVGPYELRPNARAAAAVAVTGVDPGGTLYIDGSSDSSSLSWELTLPTM